MHAGTLAQSSYHVSLWPQICWQDITLSLLGKSRTALWTYMKNSFWPQADLRKLPVKTYEDGNKEQAALPDTTSPVRGKLLRCLAPIRVCSDFIISFTVI